jgi:hypothetical protein
MEKGVENTSLWAVAEQIDRRQEKMQFLVIFSGFTPSPNKNKFLASLTFLPAVQTRLL